MIRVACAAFIFTEIAALIPFGSPSLAQEGVDQRLGIVHFSTSCNDTAQRRFDRGMRYQHSFATRGAIEIFEDVLKADPNCGIAYWGIALSLLDNPYGRPSSGKLALGAAAIENARLVGAKTQRERDYIDALAAYYHDYQKKSYDMRVQSYLKAMEALASRYSDDDEAQIAYALALSIAAPPDDKTYSNQLKGAAILEEIFKRQPRHPGVAHYLIHLYDAPQIAERGLDAARRYAEIAPAIAHAQHMPSHIFTRVGYWKESVASNLAAVRADRLDTHAMDYLVYAYLQLAQDAKAREVVDRITAIGGNLNPYALAASPARYMLERNDWTGAAALEVRPSRAIPQAVTYFARSLGAARIGNLEGATSDVAKLGELRDRLRAADDPYWAEQVDIQRQVGAAWVSYAEGKYDEAINMMSAAADAEDNTEKHVTTPGPLRPARELYGMTLLERGMPRDALAAFETTLKKEPNRYNALAGAATAAERLGDATKAKQYYLKLSTLADGSDTDRPDLVAARNFLASH
jgi:tetratricopeptide (TPR) repeat protein